MLRMPIDTVTAEPDLVDQAAGNAGFGVAKGRSDTYATGGTTDA